MWCGIHDRNPSDLVLDLPGWVDNGTSWNATIFLTVGVHPIRDQRNLSVGFFMVCSVEECCLLCVVRCCVRVPSTLCLGSVVVMVVRGRFANIRRLGTAQKAGGAVRVRCTDVRIKLCETCQ
jgi:hypothetical protein